MAQINKKYSDEGRTMLLNKTIETAEKDKSNNDHFITDETLASAKNIHKEWTEKTLALNNFLSGREKEVREKNEAVNALETCVRDMWEVVKRRVRRNGEPAEVLTYYELPLSGVIPKGNLREKSILYAAKMIEGDAKAVEAGYPAMDNPDVNELKTALDKAKKEIADVAPSDRSYDQAEEAVEALRDPVDDIISDIIDELKFHLRKKDPASQRRIIKSYGVEIDYRKGEKETDDTQPLEDFEA